MEIVRRYCFTEVDRAKQRTLRKHRINVRLGWSTFQVCRVGESHPAWRELHALFRKWDALVSIETKFTKAELQSADYLYMRATWHNGYPMPDNDFGYREITYDLREYHEKKGTGAIQKAPFHLRQEPGWSRRDIFELNWVHDEFFVRPKVWRDVFQPFGIETWPVIHHGTGKVLKKVVQLKITKTAGSCLNMPKSAPGEKCPAPVGKKYYGWCRGFFPAFEKRPKAPILKSREYFGSGGSAWHAVIVSGELYRAIVDAKVKGLTFMPLAKSPK
ncbi:MAG: hypothetical protein JW888_03840 [Pirellulales bacterium]|nr:hypothetical protein [Pirellulales bacterium]